jgi:hypothetical protein
MGQRYRVLDSCVNGHKSEFWSRLIIIAFIYKYVSNYYYYYYYYWLLSK